MIFLIIILLLIAFMVFWGISAYNNLVQLQTDTQSQKNIIDITLQRRYDLIPNLNETVKGYAEHEKSTLIDVTNARNAIKDASSMQDKLNANNQLSQTLSHLFAVAESYPDLKANTNFLALQEELTTTENKINGARSGYIASVNEYNTKLRTFPTSIIAHMKHFAPAEYIQISDESREAPKIKF